MTTGRAPLATIGLGLRFARAGGGLRTFLLVLGAAVSTTLLLIAVTIPVVQANQADTGKLAPFYVALADNVRPLGTVDPKSTLLVWTDGIPWGDRSIQLVKIAGSGPPPPGLATVPRIGETFLSPALADLAAGQRVLTEAIGGRQVGEIAREGLVRPDDLIAYVGIPRSDVPAEIVANGPVTAWGVEASAGDTSRKDLPLSALILGFLGVPVIALLAATSRLSAGVRERRLAALRLIGVTRRRTRVVAAIESGVAACLGAVIGLGGFVGVAQLSAGHPFAGLMWFADDFTPGTARSVAVLLGVPVVALLVVLVPLRSVARRPLTARRSAGDGRPARWRLIPLGTGLIALTAVGAHQFGPADNLRPWDKVFLVGVMLTGLGLPLAVPVGLRVIADGVARIANGPMLLLAARRIRYEPAATTRLVAAIITVLFVGTGAQAVILAFEQTPQYITAHRAMFEGPQLLDLSYANPGEPPSLERLASTPVVRGIVPIRLLTTPCGDGGPTDCQQVLVATCAQLRLLTGVDPVSACQDGHPYLIDNFSLATGAAGQSLALSALGADGQAGTESIKVGVPTEQLPVDLTGTAFGGASILLPPNLPSIRPLLAAPIWRWAVVADPGNEAAGIVAATATRIDPALHASPPYTQALDEAAGVRTGVLAATAAAGVVALLALLITAVDRAIERRRQVTAQRALGVPARTIRSSQLVQTLLPLAVGVPMAGLAGLAACRSYLAIGRIPVRFMPWSAIETTLTLGAAAAVLVAIATVPAIGGRLRPELLRQE